MSKFLALILAIVLVCAIWMQQTEADVSQRSFQIEGHQMNSVVEALAQLQLFLTNKLSAEKKCKRHAIVLSAFKGGKLNRFSMAKMVLAPEADIEKKYNDLNVDNLRDLYIDAIQKYLDDKYVDVSMIELINCLKTNFYNRDARARSLLNQSKLQTIVDQYKAITEKPMKLLLDGDARSIGLNLNEFSEEIKSTVRRWFGDDDAKFQRLFSDDAEFQRLSDDDNGAQAEEIQQSNLYWSLNELYDLLHEAPEALRCQAYSRVIMAQKEELETDAFVDQVVKETSTLESPQDSFKPDKKTQEHFLFIVRFFNPLPEEAKVWFDLDNCVSQWTDNPNAVMYNRSLDKEMVYEQVLVQLEHLHDDQSQALDRASAWNAVRNWVRDRAEAKAEAEALSQALETQQDDVTQKFFRTLYGLLNSLHDSLQRVPEALRCQAYSRVIMAQKEELETGAFVDQVVKETSTLESPQDSFKPDEQTREDFLFIVQTFNPLPKEAKVWFDLDNCVSQWTEDLNAVMYNLSLDREITSYKVHVLLERLNATQ